MEKVFGSGPDYRADEPMTPPSSDKRADEAGKRKATALKDDDVTSTEGGPPTRP